MEDTYFHESCSSCGSALQTADIEWLNEGADGEETVFELEMQPIERAAIVQTLMENSIRHRWEGPEDLVVATSDADAVDGILDDVLGEGDEDDDGEDDDDDFDDFEGGSGDSGYATISRLFIATGKVLRGRDGDDIEEFGDAANQALGTAVPLGMEEDTWADIQSAARNTSIALASDPESPVDGDLKALHNQLQQLV